VIARDNATKWPCTKHHSFNSSSFNDADSNSDYITLHGTIIKERLIGKDLEGNGLCLFQGTTPDVGAGIATGYGLDDRRSSSPGRCKNFLFSTLSRPALEDVLYLVRATAA
jgi:hypothetical protein